MLLGALVDAGVPFESLAKTAEALNVGARLEMRKVMRGGIAGTKVDVITPEGHAETAAHRDHEHGGLRPYRSDLEAVRRDQEGPDRGRLSHGSRREGGRTAEETGPRRQRLQLEAGERQGHGRRQVAPR